MVNENIKYQIICVNILKLRLSFVEFDPRIDGQQDHDIMTQSLTSNGITSYLPTAMLWSCIIFRAIHACDRLNNTTRDKPVLYVIRYHPTACVTVYFVISGKFSNSHMHVRPTPKVAEERKKIRRIRANDYTKYKKKKCMFNA